MAEEDQRAVAARFASTFARDALLDQATAEVGVDQTAIGLIDGGDKRRIADPVPARTSRTSGSCRCWFAVYRSWINAPISYIVL